MDGLAWKPLGGSIGAEEEIVGRVEVASGDDDVQSRVLLRKLGADLGDGLAVWDRHFGEDGELFGVGGDPSDAGQEVCLEALDAVAGEQSVAGTGAKDGVEDDFGGGNAGFSQKLTDNLDHGFGCEHPNLDAGEWNVFGEAVERLAEGFGGNGLDAAHTLGGLDGEGRDGRDSVEAMGGEDLEVGGYARSRRGIKTRDGEGDGLLPAK